MAAEVTPAIHDERLFAQTMQLAGTVFEYTNKHNGWLIDSRNTDPNPNLQTNYGLFVVYDGTLSYPRRLWTPWGDWKIAGSGYSWPRGQKETFLKEIDAQTGDVEPLAYGISFYGPHEIYEVRRIKDSVLPVPALRETNALLPVDEVKKAWTTLRTRYNAR